jgi:hypothetical protein
VGRPVIEGLPELGSVLEAYGLAGVREEPLEHDGWSGALLTTLTREDGGRFVLKRDSVARDWIARVTDDAGLRDEMIHAAPRLPTSAPPHLASPRRRGGRGPDAGPDRDAAEVGGADGRRDRRSRARRPRGAPCAHQAQLPDRFPWTISDAHLHADAPIRDPLRVRRDPRRARFNAGWDAFDRLVRPPVMDLIDELTVRPEPLIATSGSCRSPGLATSLGNAGLTADGAMLVIDWQLTLVAPVAVELGWFLVCNVASLPLKPEDVLERYRVAAGLADDVAWHAQWDLAVLVGLLLRGWRKGFDTEAGVVYPSGKAAAYDLAWWGSQALGAAGRRL